MEAANNNRLFARCDEHSGTQEKWHERRHGVFEKKSETHGSMNNDTVETCTSSAIKIIAL